MICWYNDNELYSNHWDLCTAEDDMDDKIIHCPLRAGRRKFIKELKIPNYLPTVGDIPNYLPTVGDIKKTTYPR